MHNIEAADLREVPKNRPMTYTDIDRHIYG